MLQLTKRESQVLELFDQGLLYKQIAARLGISVHTVKDYCQRIIVKSLAESLRHAAWLRRQEAAEQRPDTFGTAETSL